MTALEPPREPIDEKKELRLAVPHDGWRERGSRTYGRFTEQLKQRQDEQLAAVEAATAAAAASTDSTAVRDWKISPFCSVRRVLALMTL